VHKKLVPRWSTCGRSPGDSVEIICGERSLLLLDVAAAALLQQCPVSSLVEVDPIIERSSQCGKGSAMQQDGLETTTVIPVDSYYPLQMYYFAGLKLYGPRTRLLKDPPLFVRGNWRQDPRNRCLMPFWNHRLEVAGTDSVAKGLSTTKNFKIYLDCCLLAFRVSPSAGARRPQEHNTTRTRLYGAV
jgi:hypothetical protein